MGKCSIPRSNPGGGVERVGDIKVTTRTSLGDKWALCNGDPISNIEANIPGIETTVPDITDANSWSNVNGVKTDLGALDVYTKNGIWYGVYANSSTGVADIVRYNQNNGEMTTVGSFGNYSISNSIYYDVISNKICCVSYTGDYYSISGYYDCNTNTMGNNSSKEFSDNINDAIKSCIGESVYNELTNGGGTLSRDNIFLRYYNERLYCVITFHTYNGSTGSAGYYICIFDVDNPEQVYNIESASGYPIEFLSFYLINDELYFCIGDSNSGGGYKKYLYRIAKENDIVDPDFLKCIIHETYHQCIFQSNEDVYLACPSGDIYSFMTESLCQYKANMSGTSCFCLNNTIYLLSNKKLTKLDSGCNYITEYDIDDTVFNYLSYMRKNYEDICRSNTIHTTFSNNTNNYYFFDGNSVIRLPVITVDEEAYCFMKIKE